MAKPVRVQDIEKGMYVVDLDRPWTETPFLFQGFEVRTDEQIRELQRLCRYVYVSETADPGLAPRPVGQRLRSGERAGATQTGRRTREPRVSVDGDTHDAGILAASRTVRRTSPRYENAAPLAEEIAVARVLETQAREFVYTLHDDVRLGRPIDVERLQALVADMVASVIRNPDALIWFTQLREQHVYTALHSIRVAILALVLGRHLDLAVSELHVLGVGALLHDIGKLKVPGELLDKPEPLTDPEFELIKTHVPAGVKILEAASRIPVAAIEVAACHHERYTGGGYARGLAGDRIGLFGLIGAIVDSYDAMTSDRAYRQGRSPYEALGTLYAMRDKGYHAGLVDQFIQCLGTYPIGSVVELTNGAIGVVIAVNPRRYLRPTVALALNADNTPCPERTILDLGATPRSGPGAVDVRRVLAPGAHGVQGADYMPGRIVRALP